mmetsp:Transcript_110219/g.355790  ORF Transcript_110219/g.355790 Transcript_110219/m.355790 type:complete len:320 (+) Transcript_110219:443-1402(+)
MRSCASASEKSCLSNKALQTAARPARAAQCSGVRPDLSLAFTSAESAWLNTYRAAASSPASMAWKRDLGARGSCGLPRASRTARLPPAPATAPRELRAGRAADMLLVAGAGSGPDTAELRGLATATAAGSAPRGLPAVASSRGRPRQTDGSRGDPGVGRPGPSGRPSTQGAGVSSRSRRRRGVCSRSRFGGVPSSPSVPVDLRWSSEHPGPAGSSRSRGRCRGVVCSSSPSCVAARLGLEAEAVGMSASLRAGARAHRSCTSGVGSGTTSGGRSFGTTSLPAALPEATADKEGPGVATRGVLPGLEGSSCTGGSRDAAG